ncbi:hypothetical protein EV181_006648, partial [Coemansia sp. RSA 532]
MFELKTTSSLISELRVLVNLKMKSDEDDPIQYWYSALTMWNDFCSSDLDLKTAGRLVILAGLAPRYAAIRDKFANVAPAKLSDQEVLSAIQDSYTLVKESQDRHDPGNL